MEYEHKKLECERALLKAEGEAVEADIIAEGSLKSIGDIPVFDELPVAAPLLASEKVDAYMYSEGRPALAQIGILE